MPIKSNKEDFVAKARLVHGDEYGYDNFDYKGSKVKSFITCKIHGDFPMNPNNHLNGHGCPECGKKKGKGAPKSLVCGVGVNDMPKGYSSSKVIRLWNNMILRCCDDNYKKIRHSYKDAKVCEEWKLASNFVKWFDENYIEGYALDKDILVKGNKIYSPQTCCFVPQEINSILASCNKKNRGKIIGVGREGIRCFRAYIKKNGKNIRLGTFTTPEEAFQAYKTAKEAYIKEVAQEYYDRGEITKKVYDALMRYEFEITD